MAIDCNPVYMEATSGEIGRGSEPGLLRISNDMSASVYKSNLLADEKPIWAFRHVPWDAFDLGLSSSTPVALVPGASIVRIARENQVKATRYSSDETSTGTPSSGPLRNRGRSF